MNDYSELKRLADEVEKSGIASTNNTKHDSNNGARLPELLAWPIS